MKNKKTFLISLSVFIVFIVVSAILYKTLSSKLPTNQLPQQGEQSDNESENGQTKNKAQDFTIYDTDGNAVNLSDKLGKPIVINFWASWCPPCKMELPHFNEVFEEVGDDIEFMMIDMVSGRETEEKGKAHIEEKGYGFPVYFDTDQDAAYEYGITSLPTTLFIDKDGYIVAGAKGMINKETLLKGIDMIKDKENNNPQKITGEQAKQMFEELDKDDYVILDVRTDEEYRTGHIDGAVVVPNDEIQQEIEGIVDDKDKTLFIYCRSGNRSAAAAEKLAKMGYTSIYDFGGIIDWEYDIVSE
ncbi:MAG: redoxin domain-containing protein [Oscillospiraceae bacterium]